MSWSILGAGAIGCLWAASLQQAGKPVTLILRNAARLAAFEARGGIRVVRDGRESFCPVAAELATATRPIKRLLVCTKAYDTTTALEPLLPRLAPDARVLILQNGLGNQQQAARLVGAERLLVGSTTDGAWLRAPFEVVHAGAGETAIGTLDGHDEPLLHVLPARFALRLRDDPEIGTTLWRKLAVNCAINPLTAVYGCRNGELAERPDYRQALGALCAEIEQVALAQDIVLFEGPLSEQALRVARATAANYSSMLQDIRHGRRTEIEQITGYLCAEAERLGIATPRNRELLDRIRRLQAGKVEETTR